MNIRNVVNKDKEYFARLNEEINLYAERYGEKTAKSYYRSMLINEDGDQTQQQPGQTQQASQQDSQQAQNNQNNQQNTQQDNQQQTQSQPQQPAIDNQKMLQEFGNIGQQLEKFVQSYSNSPQAKELNDLLNSMKNLANSMKNNQQAQQQNQTQG